MGKRHVTTEEARTRIRSLGDWFHNMTLAGVETAPGHFLGDFPGIKWRRLKEHIPLDLRGATVLDVGCNAGFYSIEMKKRGASLVVGIDEDPRYLAQAKLACELSGVAVELRQMSVYDVEQLERRFDLVLFMGVLYHLRHPLLALDRLHEYAVGDLMVFQSMLRGSNRVKEVELNYPFSETNVFLEEGFPALYFVEHHYAEDWTNWWIPNRACVEAMLRSAGFDIEGRPEEEIYMCRRREKTLG